MTIAEKLLRAKTDIDEVHEAGYNKGNADGQATGYTNGYNQCTEDMQDDLQSKYDEGYAQCNTDMQDDLQAKYDEGYDTGKADTLPTMTPIEIQAQYRYSTPTVADDNIRIFPESVFETANNSFYDFADYGVTESSGSLTLTATNYTNCYAHFYFNITEYDSSGHIQGTGYNEHDWVVMLVCPPNTDRSTEFQLKGIYGQDEYWEAKLKGVRFSIYEQEVSIW